MGNAAAVAAAAGAGAAGAGGPGTVAQLQPTRAAMLEAYSETHVTIQAYREMLRGLGDKSKLVAAKIDEEGKSMDVAAARKKSTLEKINANLKAQQELINSRMEQVDKAGAEDDVDEQNTLLEQLAADLKKLEDEAEALQEELKADAGGRRRRRRGSKTTKRLRRNRRNRRQRRNTRRHR
jgi:hypothetical protein